MIPAVALFGFGLTVLAEGSSPNVDIIVIHVFDGEPPKESAWAVGNIFWPRDLLPQKFPHARILLYGFYPWSRYGLLVPVHGKNLHESIGMIRKGGMVDNSNRPIVFICDGLGGILAQEVLFSSHEESSPIIQCTSGVIFLDLKTVEKGLLGLLESQSRLSYIPPILAEYNIPHFFYLTESPRVAKEGDIPLGEKSYSISGYQFTGENDPGFVAITKSITSILVNKFGGGVRLGGQKSMPQSMSMVLGQEGVMMTDLALIYWNSGSWDELEDLGARRMAMGRRCLGEDHPDTLAAMAILAGTYGKQRRWKEAEALGVQVVAMRKRVLGEHHPDTLVVMANLAVAYGGQGRWEEAEDLETRVMDMSRQVLGESHLDTLTTMANLAATYEDQGRWKEAEDLEVHVLTMRKMLLGECHPDTLAVMANLAATYGSQGRWTEEEAIEVQVIDMSKRILGESHPNTLIAMSNLAATYWNQGRFEEAENLGIDVMAMRERSLGKSHPETLTTMANLALTYGKQGRWKKAEELEVQVVAMRKVVLGPEHPQTLRSMYNLLSTYVKQGRLEEAEDMKLELAMRESVFCGPHLKPGSLGCKDKGSDYDPPDSVCPRASSSLLAPPLPRISKNFEDDIAKVLVDSTGVSGIVTAVLKGRSLVAVDQQLSHALEEFMDDIEVLSISRVEIDILRNIRNKDTLGVIARKIRELSVLEFGYFSSNTALKPQGPQCPGKSLGQEGQEGSCDSPQHQPSALNKPYKVKEPDGYNDFGGSSGFGGFEPDQEDSSDEEPLDLLEPDIPIEQVLTFLKSKGVPEAFEKAVIKRLTQFSRNSNQGDIVHISGIGGATRAPQDISARYDQKTTKVVSKEASNDQAYESGNFLAEYETGTGNTSQKQLQKDSSTSSGSESRDTRRERDFVGNEWIDPDLRTKYLQKKRRGKLVTLTCVIPAVVSRATPAIVANEGVATASTEASRGELEDLLEKETQEEYLSPHSTIESHGTYDPAVSVALIVGDRYSWPARFAAGKMDINFEIACHWSLFNQGKVWAEELVREPINWWPLSPRRHPLPEGYLWVNWKCRCGKRISSVISKERRDRYNQWIYTLKNPSSTSNTQTIPSTGIFQKLLSGTINSGKTIASGNPSLLPTANPLRVSGPPANQTAIGGGNFREIWLIWCVNLGPRLTIVGNIAILQSDKDAEIFKKLRDEYHKIRGWRRWFSLYSISDIRFVKFKHSIYHLYRVECHNKQELPTPTNPYYEYVPKPPEEVPPVLSGDLMECFGNPSCASGSAEALGYFPKKNNGKLDQKERYGWGLHACEHLSFFRTAILSTVILAGPIGFFKYWLVEHPGDLQNASVPLVLALAFIGTFIILPHYFGGA